MENENKEKIIGNNMIIKICDKNYVLGLKRDLLLMFMMSFLYISLFIFWIIILRKFHSLLYFIIVIIFFIIMFLNYWISFLKEPGIIPRNSSKFSIIKKEEEKKKTIPNQNKGKNITEIKKTETQENSIEKIFDKENKKTIYIFPFMDETKNNNNDSLIFVKDDTIPTISNIIKDNTISEKIKTTSSNELINNIPLIYIKKPCPTCNIMRPPKASHCKICDNCILELDHHCFYISNCVGLRNHKNFYLFLLFGTFLSILVHISCFYHFIYVVFFFNFDITKNMFLNYKSYILFSVISIIFLIIMFYFQMIKIKTFFILCIIPIIVFNIVFYINKYQYINNQFPKFYHTLSSFIIFGNIPLFLFVIRNLYKQTFTIGKGLTIKQYNSIENEKRNRIHNKLSFNYLDVYLKKNISLLNIYKFLINKPQSSLVNN